MKVFIVFGSLIVTALLVLLIGPLFVDWTAYRTQFEAEASRLLGQRVEVRGAASARLLPFPSVTFGNVVVGDPADPVLSIRSFRMDAELAPYLSGEIRIFDMRLDQPRLSVPILSDGTVRWPVAALALGEGAGVILEHVVVTDGSVVLEDRRAGRQVLLSEVESDLAAQSLAGPFSGTATLRANGEPLGLTLSTGQLAPDGGLPVRLTVASPRADATVALDAILSSDPGRPIAEGKLQFVSPVTPPLDPQTTAGTPVRATGAVKLTTADAALSDLRIEVGTAGAQPYVIEGGADVAIGVIPHFDVTLRGQATDFDRIASDTRSASPTFRDRIDGLRSLVARLPTSPIPGRVQLALPLLTVGDTDLRDVSFAGSPTADGWSIDTFAAELPGRSRLEGSGIAKLRDRPSFEGSLLLAVRQPAAFFNWAGLGASPELVSLSRAGFSAKVDLSADTQRLNALEVDLDGGTLTGSLLRTVRPEGTANVVDLKGGRIDLRPLAAVIRALPNAATIAAERFDVQFDAGPVTFGRYDAEHLAADFTLQDGTLDIADANAEGFANASLHAEGTIDDLFSAPRPDLSIDILAPEPSRLLALMEDLAPDSPFFRALQARASTLAPLTLAGTLASPRGDQTRDLLLALSGTVGGTNADLRLALENGLAAQWLNGRFGLDATLRNDDPTALLAQLGRPGIAIGALPALTISLNASGSPGNPIAASMAATAGGSSISANGQVSLDNTGLVEADTSLRARSDDAAPWLTTLGIAAGQTLERLPVDLTGALRWTSTAWQVEGLRGMVADETLAASLQAPVGQPVTGSLELSAISTDWLARALLGVDDVQRESPFGPWLVPARAFAIDVAVDRLESEGGVAATDLQMLLSNDGAGLLSATELSAAHNGARLSGVLGLRNVDGLLNVEGSGAIASWQVTGTLLQAEADLSGRIAGAGRRLAEVLPSLNGSGEVALSPGRLLGISPDVLTPLTLAADSQSAALDAETVATLVAETADGARFPIAPLRVPFQIGAGVLRTEPFAIANSSARLEGEASLSLESGALAGQLTLLPATSETVRDTEPPRIDYRLAGTPAEPKLETRTEALTSYFGVRAFQREQARVDALREELSEAARLRREARLYRERGAIRDELRDRRLEAEEAERRRQAEEEEARRNAAEAAARAEAARAAATPSPMPDLTVPVLPQPQPPPSFSNGLPGVGSTPRF